MDKKIKLCKKRIKNIADQQLSKTNLCAGN